MPNGAESRGRFRLSISTPSRHPANQDAYDALTHRYAPRYIQPESWLLILVAVASPPALGAQVRNVTFTAEGVGFAFRATRTVSTQTGADEGDGREALWRGTIPVPRPAGYSVRMRVELRSGQTFESQRVFAFDDLLVVSIGDSFSSGQGNPDLDAIPRFEDIPFCKTTTVTMIAIAAKDLLGTFKAASIQVIQNAPLVGKTLAAAIGRVEDATGMFRNTIATGIRIFTDGIRTIVAGFGELAEDLFGKIGIGDGAEGSADDPRPALWQEPLAYRSYRSGWSLAARLLETDSRNVSQRVTFLSFARSGSEIRAGLLGPRTAEIEGQRTSLDGWIQHMGQVEEAQRAIGDRRIDVLLVSIGGNDLGFSGTLTDLVRQDSWLLSFGEGGDDSATRERILREARVKLNGSLSADFDVLQEAIQARLNPRHVLIAEYPTGLFTQLDNDGRVVDGRGCGVFSSNTDLDIGVQDGKAIRTLGNELNTLIREKAARFGWGVVDGIKSAHDGHGYCAESSFFVGAEESCLRQGDFEGMMHPNAKGQDVIRDCVVRAIRRFATDEWPVIVAHTMFSR